MADVLLKLNKLVDDLSVADGYEGYIRVVKEAIQEIERLRAAVRRHIETQKHWRKPK